MILYSHKNPVIDSSRLEFFDEGGCAEVFFYYNLFLKIYKPNCDNHLKIKKYIFELLKVIDAPNIVKLIDCYFNIEEVSSRIAAYTMNPVNGKKIDLMKCERNHLIELFKNLEVTLKLLSKYEIILDDLHKKNIIFTDDCITILDPDLFFKKNIFYNCDSYRLNKLKLIDFLNSYIYLQFLRTDNLFIYPFITEHRNNLLSDDISLSLTENTIYDSGLSKSLKIK